jgi:hypothetical protein
MRSIAKVKLSASSPLASFGPFHTRSSNCPLVQSDNSLVIFGDSSWLFAVALGTICHQEVPQNLSEAEWERNGAWNMEIWKPGKTRGTGTGRLPQKVSKAENELCLALPCPALPYLTLPFRRYVCTCTQYNMHVLVGPYFLDMQRHVKNTEVVRVRHIVCPLEP